MTTTPDPPAVSILIVDDERSYRMLIGDILRKEGYEVTAAANGQEALELLGARHFHAAVIDLKMPVMDGMTLLGHLHARHPEVVPVVLTAHGTVDTAVEAMKLGALDYLSKPLESPDELRVVIRKCLEHRRLSDAQVALGPPSQELVYEDPAMGGVLATAEKVAQTAITVLLLGESGTGKEVVARTIHGASPRAGRPFVAINCAALSEHLLESELFGHEKGAFTGAVERKRGKFEVADGGTLFLDEVGETSPALQAKLLRVLQERTFERVGGTSAITVDVRIIAATNRDLEAMVQAGSFRMDLFYRINVVTIKLPPLRERPGDILPLARHFARSFARKHGVRLPSFTAAGEEALVDYAWPGNVRELMNQVERAVILADSPLIGPDLLGLPSGQSDTAPTTLNLKELELHTIKRALAKTGGNRREAAELLGISKRALQYKLKDMGMTSGD